MSDANDVMIPDCTGSPSPTVSHTPTSTVSPTVSVETPEGPTIERGLVVLAVVVAPVLLLNLVCYFAELSQTRFCKVKRDRDDTELRPAPIEVTIQIPQVCLLYLDVIS